MNPQTTPGFGSADIGNSVVSAASSTQQMPSKDVVSNRVDPSDTAHRYYQIGDYDAAEKQCLEILQTDPNHVGAMLLLSSVYFQRRDLEK